MNSAISRCIYSYIYSKHISIELPRTCLIEFLSHQALISKGVGLKCHAYSSNFVEKSKLDLVMHNIVKTHSLLILWFLYLVVSGNKRHFWLCLN